MLFDPENPIVKLCAEGMQAEAEGKIETARTLFGKAWDNAANDFEAFTAAHYMARNQTDAAGALKWNLEALSRAKAIKDDDVRATFPSLYLNVGKSCEDMGDIAEAARYYLLAADFSDLLPPGGYGDMIKAGIGAALKRTGIAGFHNDILDGLIEKWCKDRALRPLSIVLPAYTGNLGTEKDIRKIISALSYLKAARYLSDAEDNSLGMLIEKLSSSEKSNP